MGVSRRAAPFHPVRGLGRGPASAFAGVISTATAFFAFALMVHPGLPGGDAGELMSAACAGGVAHPPGYPLHGLLLRLAAALPFGDVFVRLNLTSALGMAAAAGLLADLVRRWTSSAVAGVAAVAFLLSAPLTWKYATTVEVFGLHLGLVALVGWSFTRARQNPTAGWGRLLGLAGGLAVTHHPTALFVVAPLLAVEWRHWRWWTPGLVVGATPLLLLPVFSATDTPFSWGDARTVDGFFTQVLRREYGTFRLASRDDGSAGAGAFLVEFLRFEGEQAALLPVLGALVALAPGWRASRAVTVAVVVSFTATLGVFGALVNLPLDDALFREVVRRFFLMPHLVLAAVAAFGAWSVLRRWPVVLVVASAALLTAGVLRRPKPVAGVLEGWGAALLSQPGDALVLVQGDLVSGVTRALLACRGAAPGSRVIDQQQLTYDWYVARLRRVLPDVKFPGEKWHPREAGAFTLQTFLDANPGRPVVVCGGLKPGDPLPGRLVPQGLCERLVPAGAPFDDEAWWAASPAPPLLAGTFPQGSWEAVAQRDVFDARARRGLFALEQAIARGNDRQWLERAAAVLREEVVADPSPPAATWKNLGITEGRLGQTDAMRLAFERYLALAPPDDPELPQIRALLAAPVTR